MPALSLPLACSVRQVNDALYIKQRLWLAEKELSPMRLRRVQQHGYSGIA